MRFQFQFLFLFVFYFVFKLLLSIWAEGVLHSTQCHGHFLFFFVLNKFISFMLFIFENNCLLKKKEKKKIQKNTILRTDFYLRFQYIANAILYRQ